MIVAGHGAPPEYLGTTAAVADAAACFGPELIVIDTCFGASTPLLGALAARTGALVVGAPSLVPGRGFRYLAELFGAGSTEERARPVSSRVPLYIGRPGADAMARADAAVAAEDGSLPSSRHSK